MSCSAACRIFPDQGGSGIKPVCPALAGRFFTPAPSEKPSHLLLTSLWFWLLWKLLPLPENFQCTCFLPFITNLIFLNISRYFNVQWIIYDNCTWIYKANSPRKQTIISEAFSMVKTWSMTANLPNYFSLGPTRESQVQCPNQTQRKIWCSTSR